MSLNRLVYYSALIGGWAAFVAWFICESLFLRGGLASWLEVTLVAAVVGGAIGAGMNLVGGMVNAQWKQLAARLVPGLVSGLIGGAVGGYVGDQLFTLGLPRALGWMLMGLGIGAADGLYERAPTKIRNGLIGGGLGGLIGGFLFDPIVRFISSNSGMSSRATAFVIMGICIGALIGLVQVVLKEAWLTVIDGYRAGRQLILSAPVTVLGNGEHVAMPFLGAWGKDLEVEHVRIHRQPNGVFVAEDNHTRSGTRVNKQPIQAPQPLQDGDVIALGGNYVSFSEKRKDRPAATPVSAPAARAAVVAPAPPAAPPRPVPPPVSAKLSPPAVPPTARPATPAPTAKPAAPAPAAAPAGGAATAPAGDRCPKCGKVWPGKPGSRYCLVDDLMY